MWQRKDPSLIRRERRAREKKSRPIFLIVLLSAGWWLTLRFSSLESIINFFYDAPEALIYALLAPIFIASSYRSYVLSSSIWQWAPGRRCLACERAWGHSNDGWGFMVFGKRRPKWYQFRACNTPTLCDIAMDHEIIWIPETDAAQDE